MEKKSVQFETKIIKNKKKKKHRKIESDFNSIKSMSSKKLKKK